MSVAESSDDQHAIIDVLRAAIQRRYGSDVKIDDFEFATLGGSNRTVLFDLSGHPQWRRLVLRQETMPQDYTPFLPSKTQYAVLAAAHKHAVPVPEPVFELAPEDGLGDGYVVTRISGETFPKRLLHDPLYATARTRFVAQAAAALARLHNIDVAEFAVLETVADTLDPLAAQIAYYDGYGLPHPALEFAFRWLDLNKPSFGARCPLHGDFRTGNMIVGVEGLRAILDWECSFIGDPMADLGWFCTRSWRFGINHRHAGGFASRETLFRAYEAAGGQPVDREAVRWWEIFGLMRWALYNVMQACGHLSGERRSPAFAACGRNTALIEYDMLMTMRGHYD